MRRTKIIQRHQVPAKQRLGYDYNVLRNEQELVVVENKNKKQQQVQEREEHKDKRTEEEQQQTKTSFPFVTPFFAVCRLEWHFLSLGNKPGDFSWNFYS